MFPITLKVTVLRIAFSNKSIMTSTWESKQFLYTIFLLPIEFVSTVVHNVLAIFPFTVLASLTPLSLCRKIFWSQKQAKNDVSLFFNWLEISIFFRIHIETHTHASKHTFPNLLAMWQKSNQDSHQIGYVSDSDRNVICSGTKAFIYRKIHL